MEKKRPPLPPLQEAGEVDRVLVVNKQVDHRPGGAPLREIRVRLHHTVAATQPLEGDCAASRCQCGMSNLGSTIAVKLPGGSGQLVALAMCNSTDSFCRMPPQ